MLHPKKKIEIVAEEAVLPEILDRLARHGARGHTILHGVSGQGNRGVRMDDHVTGVGGNVHVMAIVDAARADAIVAACHDALAHYAGIVCVSDVAVVRPEHF